MEAFNFSNSNIDLTCEDVGVFLTSVGVEKREALRIKLSLEEILLDYQAKFGEEATFKVRCIKHFFHTHKPPSAKKKEMAGPRLCTWAYFSFCFS